MKASVIYALMLTAVWWMVAGEVSIAQTVAGLLFGTVFVVLTGAGGERRIALSELPRRIFWFAVFLFVMLPWDLVRSNLAMAVRLFRKHPAGRSGIIRLRLEGIAEPVEALEEHAITLSPGQLVVDYSPDGKFVYIHMIDATEHRRLEDGTWKRYRAVLEIVFS